jgi:hypothetical protein
MVPEQRLLVRAIRRNLPPTTAATTPANRRPLPRPRSHCWPPRAASVKGSKLHRLGGRRAAPTAALPSPGPKRRSRPVAARPRAGALEPLHTSPALAQSEHQSRPACLQVPRPPRPPPLRAARLTSPRSEASRAGRRPLLAPKPPPPVAVSRCCRPPSTVWMVRRSGEK